MDMPNNPNIGVEYDPNDLATIYLAGGCFWGTQAYIQRLLGVAETQCGYANGTTREPTYPEVKTGTTGHAETVKVCFKPSVISLERLLREYFRTINPTTINKQGGDVGSQYRTGIYYTEQSQIEIVKAIILETQNRFDKPIVTEVLPLEYYYPAEEYHQDYLNKNPNGYCHVDLGLLESQGMEY